MRQRASALRPLIGGVGPDSDSASPTGAQTPQNKRRDQSGAAVFTADRVGPGREGPTGAQTLQSKRRGQSGAAVFTADRVGPGREGPMGPVLPGAAVFTADRVGPGMQGPMGSSASCNMSGLGMNKTSSSQTSLHPRTPGSQWSPIRHCYIPSPPRVPVGSHETLLHPRPSEGPSGVPWDIDTSMDLARIPVEFHQTLSYPRPSQGPSGVP